MDAKIKVRLILSDWVKTELRMLDRAEADRACKTKVKAIAAAKKRVRDSLVVQAMPGTDTVRYVSSTVYQVYKNTLRDVGKDTFVFDNKTIKSVCEQLSKLDSATLQVTK